MSPASKNALNAVGDVIVPILLVVLIPILAVWYVVDHQGKVRTYNAAIAACERGNLLRERVNAKFAVYDLAFTQAALTLSASTTPVGKRLHQVLSDAAQTAPEPLPLTPCRKVYDKPEWIWSL